MCGFDGRKCDYSGYYIGTGAIVLVVIIVIGSFLLRKKLNERELLQMAWHIDRPAIQMVRRVSRATVMGSRRSQAQSVSSLVNLVNKDALAGGERIMGVIAGVSVYMRRHAQKTKRIDFTKKSLLRLHQVITPYGCCNRTAAAQCVVRCAQWLRRSQL